jgi:cytochrome c oxidase cbb3-type subunit 3
VRLHASLVLLSAVVMAASAGAQTPAGRPAQAPPVRPPGGGLTAGAQDKPVVDTAKAEAGKKTFVAHCSFCHGADAAGGEGGSDLIRSVVVMHDRYGEEIGKVVLAGRPEKGMPPIRLTQPQIEEISHYLHQRVAEKASRNARPIDLVVGDARAGEAYFNGAGKCSKCHSPAGDLSGIARRYDPLDLQQRVVFPRGRGRGGDQPDRNPVTVTVTPASGSPVSGVLLRIDDFTVSLRDSAGEYRSWRRAAGVVKVELHDPLVEHNELLDRYTDGDIHNLLAYLVTLK